MFQPMAARRPSPRLLATGHLRRPSKNPLEKMLEVSGVAKARLPLSSITQNSILARRTRTRMSDGRKTGIMHQSCFTCAGPHCACRSSAGCRLWLSCSTVYALAYRCRSSSLAVPLFHYGPSVSAPCLIRCCHSDTWKILIFAPVIIYLIYLLFATDHVDGKLRSRREWVRRLPIWTHFAEYFPARLHKTHDLIPTRKYIFGYHPHGIISHGAWAAFATDALGFSEKFPGITNSLLTLDSNFRLPLYREYVLSMGVQSVSKESITNILTRGGANKEGMGRAVTVVVGGARESLEAQPNSMRLIINERKGFIKVALQTGADLVPVLGFGENDLYDQLDPHKHPWLHNMQRYFLKVWKFTVPLLHGRGIFNYDVGLMPYRRPMNIVVGKPIPVFQASAPDNAEVNRLHALYTAELQKIWDRYKDEFAPHRKEEMQFMS